MSAGLMSSDVATTDREPLMKKLLFGAVVFAPFMQAFTVPVGFPLKISEVLMISALALLVIGPKHRRLRAYGGFSFLALGAIVVAAALFNLARSASPLTRSAYERGLDFDLVLYTGYALLAIASGYVIATRLDRARIYRGVGIATRLTIVYCVLQMLTWKVGAHGVLENFSGALQLGQSYGSALPRNGPFLEGNYLGFFAGSAIFICALARDKGGMWCAVALVFYAQSTSALLAISVAVALILLVGHGRGAVKWVFFGGFVVLIFATFVPSVATFAGVQLAKVGVFQPESGTNYSTSRVGRQAGAKAGFQVGIEQPLLGVGPGRFGAWNDTVVDTHGYLVNPVTAYNRPITNNAYAQVVAEEGLAACAVLVGFLFCSVMHLRRAAPAALGLAGFVLSGLNAVPSWTILPVWIAIAVLSIEVRTKVTGIRAASST